MASVYLGRGRGESAEATGPGPPVACVRGMFDAMEAGDVDAFLEFFAGPARSQMQARLQSGTRERFAAELRNRSERLKGISITDETRLAYDEHRLTLEEIYAEHNDRYRLRLRLAGEDWRIVEMTPLERAAPEIPYGTPVVPGLDDRNSRPSGEDGGPQ